MCGIICLVRYGGKSIEHPKAMECLSKLSPRGPDKKSSMIIKPNEFVEIFIGFTRLAIMDTSNAGMQPFMNKSKFVICNGEIYNFRDLALKNKIAMNTHCDCEIILPLYEKVGFKQMVSKELDAEFAMVLVNFLKNKLYACRDRYGVRPLFYGHNVDMSMIGFASEMKALHPIMNYVEPVVPGNIIQVELLQTPLNPEYKLSQVIKVKSYFDYNLNFIPILNDVTKIHENIRKILIRAVEKRLDADRPIGFLLSGGLDSSLVVSIATKILGPEKIICFSVGLENSPDVIAAKKVVEYLGIKKHHIVPFSTDMAESIVPEVIKVIETYDITTIRASVGQYILAKYVKEKSNIRVLLSGEGSDEIHGSYKYFRNAPNCKEFHDETIRLLRELYMFDNLRTDRTMASQGLEVRVPFLDFDYVNFITMIDPNLLMYKKDYLEKKIVRDAFIGYLPEEILYRAKEAFSDAVNTKESNWFRILQEKLESKITDDELANNEFVFNKPQMKEALYYRRIFSSIYPNRDNIISHYWLPKWQNEKIIDPSATILNC